MSMGPMPDPRITASWKTVWASIRLWKRRTSSSTKTAWSRVWKFLEDVRFHSLGRWKKSHPAVETVLLKYMTHGFPAEWPIDVWPAENNLEIATNICAFLNEYEKSRTISDWAYAAPEAVERVSASKTSTYKNYYWPICAKAVFPKRHTALTHLVIPRFAAVIHLKVRFLQVRYDLAGPSINCESGNHSCGCVFPVDSYFEVGQFCKAWLSFQRIIYKKKYSAFFYRFWLITERPIVDPGGADTSVLGVRRAAPGVCDSKKLANTTLTNLQAQEPPLLAA